MFSHILGPRRQNTRKSEDEDERRWQKTVYDERKWQQNSQNKKGSRSQKHDIPSAMELTPKPNTSRRRTPSPSPRRSRSKHYSSSD